MTPTEALAIHLTKLPEMPRPIPQVTDPAYQAWRKALDAWVAKKEDLECAVRVGRIILPALDVQPACTPRADYIYREKMPRKRPNKPKWSGATPQYFREKQAERRAKIREGLAERKKVA